MSVTIAYEIVGFSAKLFRTGSFIGVSEMNHEYDDMVLTTSGDRCSIEDVATQIPHNVWRFNEDALVISFTGFAGSSDVEIVSGMVSAGVSYIGAEDTFDSHWKDITNIALAKVVQSEKEEASFATLWKCCFIVSPSSPYGPEEYDEEIELLGAIDMDKMKLALEVVT